MNKCKSVDIKLYDNMSKTKVFKHKSNKFKIRQENKILFDRLANQKSLLSSKALAI